MSRARREHRPAPDELRCAPRRGQRRGYGG